MLVALSDTHRQDDHGLEGRWLDTVRNANVICHAGDFTTVDVYESFCDVADRFEAVHGNNDPPELRDRLPGRRIITYYGARIVLVHGHTHSETGLSMLARQEGADVLIVGHSHRPRIALEEGCLFVNPGSHADPRRWRAAIAEIDIVDREDEHSIEARLRDSNGDVFEQATV